jgi:hypothetical protein
MARYYRLKLHCHGYNRLVSPSGILALRENLPSVH